MGLLWPFEVPGQALPILRPEPWRVGLALGTAVSRFLGPDKMPRPRSRRGVLSRQCRLLAPQDMRYSGCRGVLALLFSILLSPHGVVSTTGHDKCGCDLHPRGVDVSP